MPGLEYVDSRHRDVGDDDIRLDVERGGDQRGSSLTLPISSQ
jgi:hypothetical protein